MTYNHTGIMRQTLTEDDYDFIRNTDSLGADQQTRSLYCDIAQGLRTDNEISRDKAIDICELVMSCHLAPSEDED